tara:strand:- start:33 stop:983 length:951 start_codon:yes stop_codon:yes gene_type:complete
MPKYLKKRKRGECIEHGFFYGNEYKPCSVCNEWKLLDQFAKMRNGKGSSCKPCKKKKEKQRQNAILEKRKKEREAARGTGFLVCLQKWCAVKDWLQPLDQFISDHVHRNKHTNCCLTCRNKQKKAQKQRYTACQKVWDDWRKTHPCVKCMNDPNYKHNYLVIEADHLGGKVVNCSDFGFWSHSQRGIPALRAELMKCQALCKFHHRLVTQQRRNKTEIQCKIRRRAVINKEKHKRGCCLKCKRVLKEGEECAFDFDHRDPNTKFMYNGKAMGPSAFACLPDALFDTQWPIEKELVDLLCANCHKVKTNTNRDGYKK